jgi:hypothetical protein
VPHAFQDILGAEATPTLCYTIYAMSAFIQRWEELIEDNPEWENFIRPGLDKLEGYTRPLDDIPAYILAMGNVYFDFILTSNSILINSQLWILQVNSMHIVIIK